MHACSPPSIIRTGTPVLVELAVLGAREEAKRQSLATVTAALPPLTCTTDLQIISSFSFSFSSSSSSFSSFSSSCSSSSASSSSSLSPRRRQSGMGIDTIRPSMSL
eukprot:GHVU01151034.1.p2 GENE.GHVU01151034.1~~GHVU01151034.1.p2  ORF type:complete len:106 (-),score=25.54 GHVU01151034.1:123-440(-)